MAEYPTVEETLAALRQSVHVKSNPVRQTYLHAQRNFLQARIEYMTTGGLGYRPAEVDFSSFTSDAVSDDFLALYFTVLAMRVDRITEYLQESDRIARKAKTNYDAWMKEFDQWYSFNQEDIDAVFN